MTEGFAEPWHGQVHALVEHLKARGIIGASEWAEALGAELSRRGTDGGNSYYDAFLAALEAVLAAKDIADPKSLSVLKSAWEDAYMSTPHGQPVRLPD